MIRDKDRNKYMEIIKQFWTEEDLEQMHEATIGGIVACIHMALKEHEQRSEPVSLKRFVMCTDVAIDALVELEDTCKEMKLENTSKQVKEVIGDLVCAKHEIEKYT